MLPLLVVAIGAGVAALAVLFWKTILNWAEDSLRPWLRIHAPALEKYASQAFVALDRVASKVRLAARDAWREIRRVLLQQTIDFERQSDGTWTGKIKSILEDPQQAGQFREQTTIRTIAWEELPPAVRESYLRNGQTSRTIDITAHQDQEVLTHDA